MSILILDNLIGPDDGDDHVVCPDCGGIGVVAASIKSHPCKRCGGTGFILENELTAEEWKAYEEEANWLDTSIGEAGNLWDELEEQDFPESFLEEGFEEDNSP